MAKVATIPIRVEYHLSAWSIAFLMALASVVIAAFLALSLAMAEHHEAADEGLRRYVQHRERSLDQRIVKLEFMLDGVDAGRMGLLELRLEDLRKRLAKLEPLAPPNPEEPHAQD